MDPLDTFTLAARAFSEWCVSTPGDSDAEAIQAMKHISRLVACMQDLRDPPIPNGETVVEVVGTATWQAVYDRCAVLPFNYYSSTLDCHIVPGELPGVEDLADDIADIHQDLAEGLAKYDSGDRAAAQWSFVFLYRAHWGQHATSAMKALHTWICRPNSSPRF